MPEPKESHARLDPVALAGTRLAYQGEIAADLWRAGERWSELVGRRWEQTVASSLGAVKAEAERRAAASAASRRP
jgi:hypothetical protein